MKPTLTIRARARLALLLAMLLPALFAAGVNVPTTYNYDRNNQLAKATYSDGRQVTYGYDDMGNLVSIVVASTSAPVVLVAEPIHGTINLPIADYQIAVRVPADVTAYKAAGLPAGLKFNAGTNANADGKAPGIIYGTPTLGGSFAVQLSAKSAVGTSSPVTLFVNIANPFTRIDDHYDLVGKALAAVAPSSIAGGELGGSVALTVAASGDFSGKLTLGAKTYSFKARLDAATGAASVTIDRPAPLTDLTLNLVLSLAGTNRGVIGGSLSDGVISAAIDGAVSVWGTANRATVFSGAKGATYNVALVADVAFNGNAAYPQGTGFATVKFTPMGDVTIVGKLADGTAISGKSMVYLNGDAPVFLPLYRATGAITGKLQASDGGSVDLLADNTIGGTLTWQRPAMTGALYPAGFPAPMTLHPTGGHYIAPARGWRVLDLGNGAAHPTIALELFLGGLPAEIDSDLTISTANVVTAFTPNSNSLALKFNAKAGLFSGKFTVPSPTRTTTFQGILLPARDNSLAFGIGYFLLPGATPADPTLSGQATLEP